MALREAYGSRLFVLMPIDDMQLRRDFGAIELADSRLVFLNDGTWRIPAREAIEARHLFAISHFTDEVTVTVSTKILAADLGYFFHRTPLSYKRI